MSDRSFPMREKLSCPLYRYLNKLLFSSQYPSAYVPIKVWSSMVATSNFVSSFPLFSGYVPNRCIPVGRRIVLQLWCIEWAKLLYYIDESTKYRPMSLFGLAYMSEWQWRILKHVVYLVNKCWMKLLSEYVRDKRSQPGVIPGRKMPSIRYGSLVNYKLKLHLPDTRESFIATSAVEVFVLSAPV